MAKQILPDDRKMILNLLNWPNMVLPLKRRNNELADKNLGFIFGQDEDKGYTVYHAYIFDLPMSKEKFEQPPTTKYKSLDDMLQDDWIVD